jgi:hypothetical protein
MIRQKVVQSFAISTRPLPMQSAGLPRSSVKKYQAVRHHDEICGLAAFERLEARRLDRLVRIQVEVRRPQEGTTVRVAKNLAPRNVTRRTGIWQNKGETVAVVLGTSRVMARRRYSRPLAGDAVRKCVFGTYFEKLCNNHRTSLRAQTGPENEVRIPLAAFRGH